MLMFARLMVGGFVLSAIAGHALAADATLTIHHFLSPKSETHKSFIVPWAKRIEQQSQGRIKFEIFPSMAMGGKPPELYRQVRDGTADIIWTLIGYTPGVFPRSEVFELPTIHRGSAAATNQAIQENFGLVAEDYKDLQPILVHVHAGNAIHMRTKAVRQVSDLRGLKLRTPSRTGAWLIQALGAEPVGMPVPALPQALSKGVVDGALVPFEILLPLKLPQLTRYSIEGADNSRFGTSVFLFAMNKERYKALPADLRAIIDANSGAGIAKAVGEMWDNIEEPGKVAQEKSGGEVIKLDEVTKGTFDALGATVVRRWLGEAKARGIDGAALVKAVRTSMEKFSR